jgi:hypothetical protein
MLPFQSARLSSIPSIVAPSPDSCAERKLLRGRSMCGGRFSARQVNVLAPEDEARGGEPCITGGCEAGAQRGCAV